MHNEENEDNAGRMNDRTMDDLLMMVMLEALGLGHVIVGRRPKERKPFQPGPGCYLSEADVSMFRGFGIKPD